MKTMISVLLLTSLNAFAQAFTILECKVTKPCQFVSTGLNYCAGNTSVRINDRDENGFYNHFVVGKQIPGDFREIFRIAADFKVQVSSNARTIIGNSADGDSWVKLTLANDGSYKGEMTLEQDFLFKLTCSNRR